MQDAKDAVSQSLLAIGCSLILLIMLATLVADLWLSMRCCFQGGQLISDLAVPAVKPEHICLAAMTASHALTRMRVQRV